MHEVASIPSPSSLIVQRVEHRYGGGVRNWPNALANFVRVCADLGPIGPKALTGGTVARTFFNSLRHPGSTDHRRRHVAYGGGLRTEVISAALTSMVGLCLG
jgi:hypothetical protein